MTVTQLFVGGHTFAVTGEGYSPTGTIQQTGRPLGSELPAGVRTLSRHRFCVTVHPYSVIRRRGRSLAIQLKERCLWSPPKGFAQGSFGRPTNHFAGEVPFDPERKMMTVVRKTDSQDKLPMSKARLTYYCGAALSR